MNYLVDTDWVADYLKGRPHPVQVLDALAEDGLAISIITYGEIHEGIVYGTNPEGHARVFRQFLRGVDVLSLNRPIMQRFARIRGDLRRQGLLIGDFDILIGATAVHYDLTLVTRNVAHFQRIPEIKLYKLS
ncbi:MAG: type II toxin-antitoxin system VapC family toxin [Anaerolineae bacterium]|nr:type II toxin-antitoxin system VapC family toxin [Anaerolineae bacterium]